MTTPAAPARSASPRGGLDLVGQVRAALRIEDVIGETLALKKDAGGRLKACCPIHAEKTASFTVYPDRQSFKCFGCGAAGDVLNWLAWVLHRKLKVDGEPFREVLRLACERAGIPWPGSGTARRPAPARPFAAPCPPAISEPVPPVPDQDLLERVIGHAVDNLTTPQAQGYLRKRGLTAAVCGHYGVGFMPFLRFKGWAKAMPDVWCLPISDVKGPALALKLHRENAPRGRPKGLWAPLGTEPADKPRHGWQTLWPCPEWFPTREPLFLFEGELKALAAITGGKCATSTTVGAGFRWTPGLVRRMAGRRVVIVYDKDLTSFLLNDGRRLAARACREAGLAYVLTAEDGSESEILKDTVRRIVNPGGMFRDDAVAALRSAVAELRCVTLGQKGEAA